MSGMKINSINVISLQRENAKLREEVATLRAFASQMEDAMREPTTIDRLEHEIDGLRAEIEQKKKDYVQLAVRAAIDIADLKEEIRALQKQLAENGEP